MATIKAYTDISQSKKLAEILPIESADMFFSGCAYPRELHLPTFSKTSIISIIDNIPCWSLTALLDTLPFPQLSKDNLGSSRTGWMVSVYPDNCRYDSCWHDNPIDCCVEMIVKLKEQNLL